MSIGPYHIIKRPVVTEKTATGEDALNQVVFEVDPKANKHQIKQAVETIFNVKVKSVNTARVRGKPVRRGWTFTHKKGWKKAVVTLSEGQRIDFYEGF